MKFLTTTFTLLIALLIHTEVDAQYGTSAVMSIRAEVLGSGQIEASVPTFISDQLVQDIALQNVKIGKFTVRVPEEVEYSTHVGEHIEMSDGKSGWNMNSSMTSKEGASGAVSYEITASLPDSVATGFWQGEQVATIEYH